MSICNECWGKGWIEKQGVQFDCRKCKGTGVIENEPQTNEEWLRSISTREFAKELALLVLYDMPLYDRLRNVFEGGESAVIDECEKWLKEIHDESV